MEPTFVLQVGINTSASSSDGPRLPTPLTARLCKIVRRSRPSTRWQDLHVARLRVQQLSFELLPLRLLPRRRTVSWA
jgi:hypothetical protein